MEHDYVYRINLKTGGSADAVQRIRPILLNLCLFQPATQYVAIGWSYVYDSVGNITTYDDYYNAVRTSTKRIDAAHNIFMEVEENSLFWTRDMNGDYWICRAKGPAESYYNPDLDIGAVVPVEAYNYGHEVPGQIKAAFNRANAGTAQRIRGSDIYNFSKYAFNTMCGYNAYTIALSHSSCVLDNLPDFDLEELVITYIQIVHNYYVLSNSIANKSTTVKVECEFRSRNLSTLTRAVVQVKAGHEQKLCASDYLTFIEQGYQVFLYCPAYENDMESDQCIRITREQLLAFYQDYKPILSDSITKWENLIKT